MRKFFAFIAVVLLSSNLFGMRVGMMQVVDPARPRSAQDIRAEKVVWAFLAAEIENGHFVLKTIQCDTLSPVEHRRYRQMFAGLPIWGGEIIQHVRNGKVESYDGEYFIISQLDPKPRLTMAQALESLQGILKETGLEIAAERSELVIFPQNDHEFRLAYKLWVRKPNAPMFNETAIVDATTGAVLLHFSNIKSEDIIIGVGLGQRGDTLKFPTSLSNSLYYMKDSASVRPFAQSTFDGKHQYGGTIYVSSSSNNSWASDNIVNVHTYIGYTYDLYFAMFGLKGPNNANMPLKAFAHIYSPSQGLTDNAFWHEDDSMYGQGFYILDPYRGTMDWGAAIDVVAHELSHAVTSYHANLTYYGESGALNESFSDIIGTATEWMFQHEGTGYNLADWINGEDAAAPFSYDKCRRQDNPNLNSQLKNAGYPSAYWFPDPAHIAQKVPSIYSGGYPIDNDNVHINCTIYPHVFYLLAHGGTNPVSGMSVSAVGLENAIKIFYDAFVNRATDKTDFLGMANILLASSYYLYGSSSNEYAQVKQALRAIGYIVN
ncbi:MAG: M4 family metallopeptidase [Candidatus Aminicenantes bacterium]|nr:M4 family metallopeptidase [Candidatus Aminicenantes bacterium]